MPARTPSSRTLIFGGTFDPPHPAHIQLPQAAARELDCDRILYIPAAVSPFKVAPGFPRPTPALHRVAMLRLALQDSPNAEINTIELDRHGPSYTIDTLRALAAQAPPREVRYLLIGADQALDFHRWKEWRAILDLATPAVMLRPPWTRPAFAAALRERYDEAESQAWEARTLHTLPMMDVSATDIRERIADGRPLAHWVTPEVEAYIREHRLYSK